MKIKHFAGYGCVDATKVSERVGEETTEIVIVVKGNHEWGIEMRPWQDYDAFRWLLKNHFGKSLDFEQLLGFKTEHSYEDMNGEDTDVCKYIFTIRNK